MKPALLLTLEYPPDVGGVAAYLGNLVAHLPAGSVRVLAPHRMTSKLLRPRWLPMLWHGFWECMLRRPSIVVVSHVLPAGIVARILKRLFGIPYIVISHGMDLALALEAQPRKRMQAAQVLRDADGIVVNSAFTGALASAFGVAKERVTIIHPAPGLSRIEPTVEERAAARKKYGQGRGFMALTVCRLVRRKGVQDCIAAIAKRRAEGDGDTAYVIIGDGSERRALERAADAAGIRDRVAFAGAIDDKELAAVFSAADAFLLTPRRIGPDVEGFGIVYLEANLAGKPVIAARSGGVSDAVVDGVNGILVEEGDVDAIAAAIGVLKDSAVRGAMGVRGRERVLREFTWDIAAKKFSAVLAAAERVYAK